MCCDYRIPALFKEVNTKDTVRRKREKKKSLKNSFKNAQSGGKDAGFFSLEGVAKTTGTLFGMRSPWTSISLRLRVSRPQKGDEQHHLLPSDGICPIDISTAIP